VPAAAVIRVLQALSGIIGRKGCVGGCISRVLNPGAQPQARKETVQLEGVRGKELWCRGEIR
jgi:hypothetical protein